MALIRAGVCGGSDGRWVIAALRVTAELNSEKGRGKSLRRAVSGDSRKSDELAMHRSSLEDALGTISGRQGGKE